MLGFRPLRAAKRKRQAYNQVPTYDAEDADYYNEKRYDSDDDSYVSSSHSTPYSSRVSSGAYAPRRRSLSRPTVSAYSYRNPP